MSADNWNGARWWRVDIHSHTPASDDYGKGPQQAQLMQRTPRELLLDYMRAELDCVAVTDHNTGAWVDGLKQALAELESERPAGYRQIHLFAGVEISVHGGVHLLAVLPQASTTSDIDRLLGAVGYRGSKGSSDSVTSKSIADVVELVEQAGGLAIPAHADGPGGVFREQHGTTLMQFLECQEVCAVELLDPTSAKPPLYLDKGLRWAELLGSDAHHPAGTADEHHPGSHFTWVKMGDPSIEGLRLAFLDGPLSVRRSDLESGNPNQHSALALESIEVAEARYMGRAAPFTLRLNPWLNAIVGGRGTGKSTVVEFLRIALRRSEELPDELKTEFDKYESRYAHRDEAGLLTDKATIRVVYRKNGARFRVQWSPNGELDAIETGTDGDWHRAEGDVRERFPVRMYSQKQIFHLAKAPLALLRIVDDGAHRRSWDDRWAEEEGRFLSLRARAREIQASLVDETRLRGELDDVERKLAIFEQAGYADILRTYQKRSRQQRAVETWEEGWADAAERLRQVAEELVPEPLEQASFDMTSDEDARLHNSASAAISGFGSIRRLLEELAVRAGSVVGEWRTAREESAWRKAADEATHAYEELRDRLTREQVADPAAYGELVQRRQAIEERLSHLADRRKQVDEVQEQAVVSLAGLLELRRELTSRRAAFLDGVLCANRYVRIRVLPYQAREMVEPEFRRLLQREEGGFEKDIGEPDGEEGLLGMLYAASVDARDIECKLDDIKNRIRVIAQDRNDPAGLRDQRFATHLRRLSPEALDRLDAWFPEDSLDVQYSTTGDGERFRSIHEGSPGQKTAALLAFLFSYGDEPLILDQPEDDLDNRLIYDLVVTQLRDAKQRRQIVTVTHNANIVVNGDAELVVALDAAAGETQKECEGSLQERKVREVICRVMEGGREAFEQRYRRIALEGRHVR